MDHRQLPYNRERRNSWGNCEEKEGAPISPHVNICQESLTSPWEHSEGDKEGIAEDGPKVNRGNQWQRLWRLVRKTEIVSHKQHMHNCLSIRKNFIIILYHAQTLYPGGLKIKYDKKQILKYFGRKALFWKQDNPSLIHFRCG